MGKKVHLVYIKSMNIFSEHLWEWSLLVGFILFLLYAVYAIFKEKKEFLNECYFVEYKGLQFPIPEWWTQEVIDQNTLHFYRSDTRYDWDAHFQWIDQDNTDLEKIFDQYIIDEEVQFDPEVIVETNPSHLFLDSEIASKYSEFIRVEGMATQRKTERIYLDLVLFKIPGSSGYFKMQSLSSVLNGGVEGPYFESSLMHVELIR